VLDGPALIDAMREYRVQGVIHLAAKKAVGESVERPMYYYRQNLDGLFSLLEAMTTAEVGNFVYSSSAAVYGDAGDGLIGEDDPTVPQSPYGQTKLMAEWAVRSVAHANALVGLPMSYVLLRYFNVAGAANAELGDRSVANLIPLVLRAITSGERPKIFGTDYPTPDGTCIRDYIHVVDLAAAHVAAVQACHDVPVGATSATYNVGRGVGSSVREVLDVVAQVVGHDLDAEEVGRRAGDPARLVADPARIKRELGWEAALDLRDMVASAWDAWPKSNGKPPPNEGLSPEEPSFGGGLPEGTQGSQ
ncbi:MAG: UDP-glucose 4-epimerase GalE, partial [Actinomycetes bacterium]